MHGTFREDLQRWVDIWTAPSQQGRALWGRARLCWTYQPLRANALLRFSSALHRKRVPVIPGILWRLNITLHGLDIVPSVPIGGGLYLPHTVGTVVMARAIGRNVTLVSNVTIGMRNTANFPIIGNNVYIGAGARVLGDITIGDGAIIGANAVVLTDVPAGATAVGVPARILPARESGLG